MKIRVAVLGACGRMGSEVVKAVLADNECELAGLCDVVNAGEVISGVTVMSSLKDMIKEAKPQVIVDFAKPFNVENIKYMMENGISPIIGTTGQSDLEITEMEEFSRKYNTSAMIIPNFAIGAVLMMKYAGEIAKYMPDVEIIELHHDKKLDSPSGTAIKTAKIIADARKKADIKADVPAGDPDQEARGDRSIDDIHIHSVRLKGYVAHQEVIFGGTGQTLTIRHDSIDRTSFMPGVILCIKESQKRNDFIYGLDKLL